MGVDSKLVKFLEKVSNGSEPMSLSYSDFFPIESIIDFKTIKFEDGVTSIDFNEQCIEETRKVIVNINTSKHSSFDETQKIISLIRLTLHKEDILIELGSKPNENQDETTFDVVLYKD